VGVLTVLIPLTETLVLEVATLLSLEALVDLTVLGAATWLLLRHRLLLHHLLWGHLLLDVMHLLLLRLLVDAHKE